MRIEVFPDAAAVARAAAQFIEQYAQQCVSARGSFLVALSGGSTPWLMLDALVTLALPWREMQVFQVDERVTGETDQRNITRLREKLLRTTSFAQTQLHDMPVDDQDLDAGARRYAASLAALAGSPPVFDLVHLGLGDDGHTASLVPGDGALDVLDRDVALTGAYRGHRRMTLTYPVLDGARQILWLVTGESKAAMLARLRDADERIPAGRVRQDRAVVFADEQAAPKP